MRSETIVIFLRLVLLVQAGLTIGLSMLAVGRLMAHPQVVYGSISRKTIVMLCFAYDAGLLSMIDELYQRVVTRERYHASTMMLAVSLCVADYALLRIVRRAFRVM